MEAASAQPGEQEPSNDERERLEAAATAARAAETELRLTLRTREERARAMFARAESLEAAARAELEARDRAAARRERRKREATVAGAVCQGAAYAQAWVTRGLAQGAGERASAEKVRTEREAALAVVRREIVALGDQLGELTNLVHRDEVARTQQRLRIETLQDKALEEHGIDPQVLVESFGPDQMVPVIADIDESSDGSEGGGEDTQGPAVVPYVRDVQAKREQHGKDNRGFVLSRKKGVTIRGGGAFEF